ncbi:MAG: DMT family transporter, partial [Saccharofermentans sp.]|nr:DMT family transporter [Saccharofermentans sp.]
MADIYCRGKILPMNNKKSSPKGIIMLLMTAIIWGSSFVAQSVGMESIEAFTFNGIRTLIGAAVLGTFILIKCPKTSMHTIKKGVILGVIFFFASNLQQYAFYYSTAGKIAFITAFYMFFVPIIGTFLGKRHRLIIWLCVAMGLVGLFLLCINPADMTAINKRDLFA